MPLQPFLSYKETLDRVLPLVASCVSTIDNMELSEIGGRAASIQCLITDKGRWCEMKEFIFKTVGIAAGVAAHALFHLGDSMKWKTLKTKHVISLGFFIFFLMIFLFFYSHANCLQNIFPPFWEKLEQLG